MWETERIIEIAAEMKRYNLEVGQQRLASGELLLYSGHEEDNAPHTQGVALTLPFSWSSFIYFSWFKQYFLFALSFDLLLVSLSPKLRLSLPVRPFWKQSA
ncbi:hypothetical protein MS3_00005352 [Schistosoma haematobium]|uniref:Uncharacterized protein n=1 Tax=Schistosoma haematobium TaxID=6185 RepID=A0A922LK30_SCHHA|nr:hypothetical protein MS3_00005352 [Schistosoma haematobium]KAH9587720.1 hypothetical protein MS3_00005352 [Schistosoma haematobium]